MAKINDNFIRNLRTTRTNLTQDEVAEKIGVSIPTIKTLETGKKEAGSMNALAACKMAKLFGISVPELIGIEPLISNPEDAKLLRDFKEFLDFKNVKKEIWERIQKYMNEQDWCFIEHETGGYSFARYKAGIMSDDMIDEEKFFKNSIELAEFLGKEGY